MPSAWVQRRGSQRGVRYRVLFRLGGRESRIQHAGSFRTLREARLRRDWVAGALAAMRVPDLLGLEAQEPTRTLNDVLDEFIAAQVHVGPSSHAHYRNAGARFGALGAMAPEAIRPADVRAWIAAQADISANTVVKYLGVIRQVLDFADLERPNPARDPRVKVPRIPEPAPEPPSLDQFVALRAAITPKYVPALDILERTGLRVGELRALTWGDVNFREQRLLIRKGKTRSARRWVPLLDETYALLQRLRAPEDRLASLQVLPELSDQGLGRAMERACKVAGIPHFTPHDLRHRYTSLLVLAGVPLPLVPRT